MKDFPRKFNKKESLSNFIILSFGFSITAIPYLLKYTNIFIINHESSNYLFYLQGVTKILI